MTVRYFPPDDVSGGSSKNVIDAVLGEQLL